PSCTSISAITTTSRSSTACSQRAKARVDTRPPNTFPSSMTMNDIAVPKPKKSVALSGVVAGNTALCTVGRSGNDLNYRGYDILDIADHAEFEEIAYMLIHGKLPNAA